MGVSALSHIKSLRRASIAIVLLVAFLVQGTWALAGTTGSLSGVVKDGGGAPIASATVTATSPSQTMRTKTDAQGRFTFLSLSPDTYTITSVKSGYDTSSVTGITVFADNTQSVVIVADKSLTTIAKVTSRSAGDLVKSGTTSDVYSVNAATAAQVGTIGGGSNLDNAYSAIYSQPGVNSQLGVFGFGQVFYIHGSNYNQIGYEFDGVPVNRAFDNYNASSLSNLGASETQVYTGSGPASATSSSLGGYINQVIRTGTYPGFANLTASVGGPGFYHKLSFEAGGSNPARTFSYYVGIRGANQEINQLDRYNGGDLNPDGSNQYGQSGYSMNPLVFLNTELIGDSGSMAGPWTTCNSDGSPPSGSSLFGAYNAGYFGSANPIPTCSSYSPLPAVYATALRGTSLQDRENIANFHFYIPHHKDGGRDDIQILFDNFYYHTNGLDNIATNGGFSAINAAFYGVGGPNGYGTNLLEAFGLPASDALAPTSLAAGAGPNLCQFVYVWATFGYGSPCAAEGPGPLPYADGQLLSGVAFGQAASTVGPGNLTPYFFPSSPLQRPASYGISPNNESGIGNNGSIIKVQYQKNIGSNAYLRIYGYTFYSDWLMNSPNALSFGLAEYGLGIYGIGASGTAGDYELNTHTRGGQVQFADQLNAQNMFTATLNYVTANTMRMNNGQAGLTPGASAAATLMSNGSCYAKQNNALSNGQLIDPSYSASLPAGAQVSCLSSLANVTLGTVIAGAQPAPVGAAAAAGANWAMTAGLQINNNINDVAPKFTNLAFEDEFRPNDKLDLNLGLRLDRYTYQLGNIGGGAEGSFWANAINTTACVDPLGNKQVSSSDNTSVTGPFASSASAGLLTYFTTLPGQACPLDPASNDQLYHPGQHGIPLVQVGGGGQFTHTTLSPHIGGTYTLDPNTVLRFAYARTTQPVNTAAAQSNTYLDGYQSATAIYASQFYNNGLGTQDHDNQIQFANEYDLSLEKHLKGTDISFKLSPYYRVTSQQAVQVSLPGGLAGTFNGAQVKVQGVEFQIAKGDPTKNGLSGQISYTYTKAREKFLLINGANTISTLQGLFGPFFSLTKNGGGAQCYQGGVADPTCTDQAGTGASSVIANPYYAMLPNDSAAQEAAKYPLDGWYPLYANYFPNGGVGSGDATTALSPNIFAGLLAYKHDRLTLALNGILQGGQQYGTPGDFSGIDPRSCFENQSGAGLNLPANSQLADYQACPRTVVVPNPLTGSFNTVGQYREPWQLNIGGQASYDVSNRITLSLSMANIVNRCFGGSKGAWTDAYKPNNVVCGYAANGGYLLYSPNQAYNTAGMGYYYGNSPHDPANGTAGYPNWMNQAYAPYSNGLPFQAYFSVNIKL